MNHILRKTLLTALQQLGLRHTAEADLLQQTHSVWLPHGKEGSSTSIKSAYSAKTPSE